jgi:hypothetical protein
MMWMHPLVATLLASIVHVNHVPRAADDTASNR